MKTNTKLITIAFVLILIACSKTGEGQKNNRVTIHGSGNLVSKDIDLAYFDSLEAGLHFSLSIRHGEESRITITSDDNFIDFIQVDQDGSRLTFGLKPGNAYNFYDVTLHVEVSMPDLAGLTLSQSSYALLTETFSAENFEVELSGSSVLEGTLQAVGTTFDLSGNSRVNLTGSAQNMRIDSCGNSVADMERFIVEIASLELSCNSKTSVTISSKLDIDASQHSQLIYSGEPELVQKSIVENAYVGQK